MSSSLENALEVVNQVEYKLNVGIGLIDYMVKSQTDQNDDYYPPFGVYNDIDNEYKKYKTDDTELDAMYIIKANAPINTTAHANF